MSTISEAADVPDRSPALKAGTRLDSVDMLRGAVMVLMVLDHTRDFFTSSNFNPTDLSTVPPALFMTRWVTHFCAPVFAFLAGTGAFLASARGMGRGDLARFLLTRGLWLVILEQTIEPFGMTFRINPGLFLGLVLWSIGWSLVVLAGLVALRTPARVIAALGVLMIAGHNLADGINAANVGAFGPLLVLLHQPGLIGNPSTGPFLLVGYNLVPWVGVVAAGFGFGELLCWKPERRQRALLGLGIGLSAAFVALRALNVYGDPNPWSPQRTPLLTVLSFLNCTKYPPSLLFLLMTLGPALLALWWFDRGDVASTAPGRFLVTLGRVPLFYYLSQWYVIHLLALLVALVRGQPLDWLFSKSFPVVPPPESSYGLPVVYLMWAVVVAVLYPLCRWFAGVKARNRNVWWLAYL
jgi:uncharacterized membrane protein